MMIFASGIFGLSLAFFLVTRTHTVLAYYQQEEYDTARFWASWIKVRLFDVTSSVSFIVFYVIGWRFDALTIALLASSLVFVLVAMRERRYKFKKPLVLTERVKRLRLLALVILAILMSGALVWIELTPALLQAAPLALITANAVLLPYQNRLNARFVQEAAQILSEMDPVRIGITGSFGKTTVKHMLAQMLEIDAPVFFSRGSVNTKLGLTRHIRQRLQPSHKYFVAEMGAYGIGSIKRLCNFVDPQYGIITAVGDAHTERFGSVEIIAQAKSELAQWICERNGVVVTTQDVMQHAPFVALHAKYPQNFRVCGVGANADTRIVSADMVDDEWAICLRLGGAKSREITLSLPILGAHNVANIALVATLIHAVKPDLLDRLATTARHIEQIPHRLEKKEYQSGPLVLDDAYNSNELGFTNAVNVLRDLADRRGGKAILVTPGIAELGPEHARVHKSLGNLCARKCDLVYVVNPGRITEFIEGLKGGNAQIVSVGSLAEAQKDFSKRALMNEDVILYENDLPDLLEEKRLL